jgi:hypothetical protein
MKKYPFQIEKLHFYCEYDRSKKIGDVYTLNEFLEYNDSGGIIPYDGMIAHVIINDYVSNIEVDGWGTFIFDSEMPVADIHDLKIIPGNVEIEWCNR